MRRGGRFQPFATAGLTQMPRGCARRWPQEGRSMPPGLPPWKRPPLTKNTSALAVKKIDGAWGWLPEILRVQQGEAEGTGHEASLRKLHWTALTSHERYYLESPDACPDNWIRTIRATTYSQDLRVVRAIVRCCGLPKGRVSVVRPRRSLAACTVSSLRGVVGSPLSITSGALT
jgi:hypothetical protein